jgi:hypothetical protein
MQYAYKNVLFVVLVVFVIIIFNMTTKSKHLLEGFTQKTNNEWSKDLIDRFLLFQKTVNDNNYQYDMAMVQQQATPEEAEYLLKNGNWPWSNETKFLYMEEVWSSPMIKINPGVSLEQAMKTYNENAMKQLLSWNTKEGEFIIYGGDLGVSPEMPNDVRNTIKCADNGKGKFVMEKTTYNGYNTWNGYKNVEKKIIANEDVAKEMPGFSFVNGPCNPCSPLNTPAEYNCPFTLNVEGDKNISQIWKQMWGLAK